MSFENLRSEQEAAVRLGLSPGTLRNWRHLGRGPAYVKVGRRVLYPESVLENYLKDGFVDPEADHDSSKGSEVA